MATVADAEALTVYAWALLPNPAHLLVRTGRRPLARSMRSLLTGYAGAFTRRHRRVGPARGPTLRPLACADPDLVPVRGFYRYGA